MSKPPEEQPQIVPGPDPNVDVYEHIPERYEDRPEEREFQERVRERPMTAACPSVSVWGLNFIQKKIDGNAFDYGF